MKKMIFKSEIKKVNYNKYEIAEHACKAIYELDEPIVLTLNNANAAQVECTHCYFNNFAGVPEFGYLVFDEDNKVYKMGRFSVKAFDNTTGCCVKEQNETALNAYKNAIKKGNVSTNGLRTERFANINEQPTIFAHEI